MIDFKNFNTNSIKSKLILSSLVTVLAITAVFGLVVFFNLTSLSGKLADLGEQRSQEMMAQLKQKSEKDKQKIKDFYESMLKDKASGMLQKDKLTVVPMYTDNSFMALRDFLQKTFEGDGELLVASFFVEEKNSIKAWQFLSKKYSKGMEVPIEYDMKKLSWKSVDSSGKATYAYDSRVPELIKYNKKTTEIKEIEIEDATGKKITATVFDCVLPIFENTEGDDLADARKDGEAIGYLRYTLTLEKMKEALRAEENLLSASLAKLENSNKEAAKKAAGVAMSTLNISFLILLVAAIGVIFGASVISFLTSSKISQPISDLTQSTKVIANGK